MTAIEQLRKILDTHFLTNYYVLEQPISDGLRVQRPDGSKVPLFYVTEVLQLLPEVLKETDELELELDTASADVRELSADRERLYEEGRDYGYDEGYEAAKLIYEKRTTSNEDEE